MCAFIVCKGSYPRFKAILHIFLNVSIFQKLTILTKSYAIEPTISLLSVHIDEIMDPPWNEKFNI